MTTEQDDNIFRAGMPTIRPTTPFAKETIAKALLSGPDPERAFKAFYRGIRTRSENQRVAIITMVEAFGGNLQPTARDLEIYNQTMKRLSEAVAENSEESRLLGAIDEFEKSAPGTEATAYKRVHDILRETLGDDTYEAVFASETAQV